LCLVGRFFIFIFAFQLGILFPEFLELALFGIDFCFEFFFPCSMVLNKSIMQLFVFFADFLNFLLLVIFDLPDLALQLVYFLLLLLSVSRPFLPQVQQLCVAVPLCLLQRLYFGLEVLDHLGM
jgi:hypothetical protein